MQGKSECLSPAREPGDVCAFLRHVSQEKALSLFCFTAPSPAREPGERLSHFAVPPFLRHVSQEEGSSSLCSTALSPARKPGERLSL
eukprot:3539768-Amphidinium_carterae.1